LRRAKLFIDVPEINSTTSGVREVERVVTIGYFIQHLGEMAGRLGARRASA
jgi:hypothetical protein